jgi:hypothetical protein
MFENFRGEFGSKWLILWLYKAVLGYFDGIKPSKTNIFDRKRPKVGAES